MIIQIGHSREYDYITELYEPIKGSSIYQDHTFVLPHDNNTWWVNSKGTLKHTDIFLAEVSYPATGLGIELWFAHLYWTRIICFSKENVQISWSLKYISNEFFTYTDSKDLINKMSSIIAD